MGSPWKQSLPQLLSVHHGEICRILPFAIYLRISLNVYLSEIGSLIKGKKFTEVSLVQREHVVDSQYWAVFKHKNHKMLIHSVT